MAKDKDFYTEDPDGQYLYIVPRYSNTSIKVESLIYDSASDEFIANKTLFESISNKDYSFMLLTSLSEGKPKIRVTLTYKDISAIYEPTYNSQGNESYPIEKNGVFITEHIISFSFTDGPFGKEKAVLDIGDEFIGWKLTEIETAAYKSILGQAYFSGEATLRGDILLEALQVLILPR